MLPYWLSDTVCRCEVKLQNPADICNTQFNILFTFLIWVYFILLTDRTCVSNWLLGFWNILYVPKQVTISRALVHLLLIKGALLACQGMCTIASLIFGYYRRPLLSAQRISNDTGYTSIKISIWPYIDTSFPPLLPDAKYGGDLRVCWQHCIEQAVACLIPYVWKYSFLMRRAPC
jgi:hypothetical protein